MDAALTVPLLIVGIGVVLIAAYRLGAASPTIFAGLFPAQGVRDWPTGVQESDAPRFAVDHLDALRPAHPTPNTPGWPDDRDGPVPEIVELGVRRLDRR